MTEEEKIIATAFTGKMFIDGSDMGLLYEYMEKKVGHGVIDLMLADKEFWEELHKACEQDFIDMVSKKSPSLPSNLDEAAKEYFLKIYGIDNIAISEDIKRAIKFGAEWMAGQFHFVTAHCCESANPVSEGVEKPLHLITLICEDDGKNPYIVGGDNVEVCLRKKQP